MTVPCVCFCFMLTFCRALWGPTFIWIMSTWEFPEIHLMPPYHMSSSKCLLWGFADTLGVNGYTNTMHPRVCFICSFFATYSCFSDHFKMSFIIYLFLKSLLSLLQYCFFYVLVFWPWGMLDLSSQTRDRTCINLHWKAKF